MRIALRNVKKIEFTFIIVLILLLILALSYENFSQKSDKFSITLSNNNNTFLYETESWGKIIDSSFESINCNISKRKLNSSYYQGKMIDSHIHIPSIPDDINAETKINPVLGINVKIEDYICMMDYEGTSKVFAFFPVWDPIIYQHLEIINRTMDKYRDRFVPFIMPPDRDDRLDGYPTINSTSFDKMLKVYPDLFKGYGEIGLYERGDHGGPKGAKALPPNSQRLKEIYPIIRKNKLLIYFHLGEGQKENFEEVLRENRDIIFIFHGDQLVISEKDGVQNLSAIEDLLYKNPNLYYGVDELYGGVWLLKPEVKKEEFLNHFVNYNKLIEEDLKTWKGFIERHPNQVLWGTDRGWSAPWSLDQDVALTLNDYTRAFIARLNPEVQEKFAYRNAEKISI